MPGSIDNTAGTITGINGNATPAHATIYPGVFCSISFTAHDKIGTLSLDIEDVVVTNTSGVSISIIVNNGSVTIAAWLVMLNFNETGGNNDYVIFGEIHDANDGAPDDMYDIPKPPAPNPPYIRAWFDDDRQYPDPCYELWMDYRCYPDTYKVWDLYAQWKSSSSSSTNVTISWNNSEFNSCEYSDITLMRYDPFHGGKWDFAANMLTEDEYTYMPRYFHPSWLKDHFRIIVSDPILPVISDVTLSASVPIDIEPSFGWERVTCNVTDNVEVQDVKLVVINPDMTTVEYDMTKTGTNTYYYNTTLTQPGNYSYHVWANDLSGNPAMSTPEPFALPMNEDVDNNGQVYFDDLVDIVMIYGDTGPGYPDPSSFGWVREDVDNNGQAYFDDLVAVVMEYGESWWT